MKTISLYRPSVCGLRGVFRKKWLCQSHPSQEDNPYAPCDTALHAGFKLKLKKRNTPDGFLYSRDIHTRGSNGRSLSYIEELTRDFGGPAEYSNLMDKAGP